MAYKKTDPTHDIVDRAGAPVRIGTRVKVLSIPEYVFRQVSEDAATRLRAMIGQTFEVYNIDEWGEAWVEVWEKNEHGELFNHSISLASSEMEVV